MIAAAVGTVSPGVVRAGTHANRTRDDRSPQISWHHRRRRRLAGDHSAGASRAWGSSTARRNAHAAGHPVHRRELPVIGLGFADHPSCADHAALKQVLQTFYDNGGRVFDTHQSSAASEQFHATVANEVGIQNKLFLSLKGAPGRSGPVSDPAVASAQIESLLATFKVSKLDLVQMPVVTEPQYWAVMHAAKKAGRIRYIGAAMSSVMPFTRVEPIMRNEPIDFISIDYNIESRGPEEKILPLALERKIAVLTFFPFGGANGASCASNRGIFARVANTALPTWAAEFDAKTWAQFFLKYVVSHPAVTAIRTGTTKPHHILDNIGGGIGRLPNEAMRKRMAEFIDALPAIVPPVVLDRYAGEYRNAASGATFVFRRDGSSFLVKAGPDAEVALIPRSPRRFAHPNGSIFEFQIGGAGGPSRVNSVSLEQGGQKTTLERK
jgi:aryl-alcohol dehydrogenase-like predicted oxidoreductase